MTGSPEILNVIKMQVMPIRNNGKCQENGINCIMIAVKYSNM